MNRFTEATTVSEVLGILAGAASVCWDRDPENPFGPMVFDSDEAGKFCTEAEARIKELLAQSNRTLFRV